MYEVKTEISVIEFISLVSSKFHGSHFDVQTYDIIHYFFQCWFFGFELFGFSLRYFYMWVCLVLKIQKGALHVLWLRLTQKGESKTKIFITDIKAIVSNRLHYRWQDWKIVPGIECTYVPDRWHRGAGGIWRPGRGHPPRISCRVDHLKYFNASSVIRRYAAQTSPIRIQSAILCPIESVDSSVPMFMKILKNSTWFRRRRAVGFNCASGAIESNCPSTSKSSRIFQNFHEHRDGTVHTLDGTQYRSYNQSGHRFQIGEGITTIFADWKILSLNLEDFKLWPSRLEDFSSPNRQSWVLVYQSATSRPIA